MAGNDVNNVGSTGNNQSMQAYEGISVDKIKKEGSKADARAINIYDTDNNGRLEGAEVTVFNNTQRTLSKDGKTLSIFNNQDGKNQRIDITSSHDVLDSQDHLDSKGNLVYEGEELEQMAYTGNSLLFAQDKWVNPESRQHYIAGYMELGDNAHINLNVDKGTLSVSGVEGTKNYIYSDLADVNVQNSEINKISMNGGTLNADGVHDRTVFFETDTTVETDGNTTIKQNNSSLEISRKED